MQQNKNTKYIVGAYVASKSLRAWDREDETCFFSELKKRPDVRGLEHGYYGALHRFDEAWFLDNINPDWDFAFTCMPGVANRVKQNPSFGLASTSTSGRQSALDFHRASLEAVHKLNSYLKRKAVLSVQIHSAPTGNSSKEDFAKSLEEICSWDWDGAKVLVEHCDRFKTDGTHEKGYLKLEDEIWSMLHIQKIHPRTQLGALLNWGRSVVEHRSVEGVLTHIRELNKSNLLNAFLFSGTTGAKASIYKCFGDQHMPAPFVHQEEILYPDSLMTVAEMRRSLELLHQDSLDYLGFKIMHLPTPESYKTSMTMIDGMISCLKQAQG